MIGYLSGKIISKNQESLQTVLLVENIGYEVTFPKFHFEKLEVGQNLSVWIETVVRENGSLLCAFESEKEKFLFRILLGVSGLGPKTALSILGYHTAQKLIDLIVHGNETELSKAPGVGKKTAQRMILELKNKLEPYVSLYEPQKIQTPTQKDHATLKEDLSLALINLGYQPKDIKTILYRYEEEELLTMGFEGGLKVLLKSLSEGAR